MELVLVLEYIWNVTFKFKIISFISTIGMVGCFVLFCFKFISFEVKDSTELEPLSEHTWGMTVGRTV